jgi:hypothetical protein
VRRLTRPGRLALGAGAALIIVAVTGGVYAQRSRRAAPRTPSRSAGQMLFIDPATGLPREPTSADLLALQPAGVPAAPVPIAAPAGMEGLELSDDQMVYSVVTKNPDGTLSLKEVKGRKAAEGLQAGKEPIHDR